MLFAEVERNRERGRKLLLDRDSPCILPLAEELEQAPRRALTLWALEGAERIARAEGDGRLFSCVAAARAWAEGAILMPAARRAILAVHAAARTNAPSGIGSANTAAASQIGKVRIYPLFPGRRSSKTIKTYKQDKKGNPSGFPFLCKEGNFILRCVGKIPFNRLTFLFCTAIL